jgi:hypothetical protein
MFFNTMVKPPYDDWCADYLVEWKAKAAATNADNMAERVFNFWHSKEISEINGATSPRAYRTHLRTNICAEFGLIWDIHDGVKHMTLDRNNRQITNAPQTGVGQMGNGEGNYGE